MAQHAKNAPWGKRPNQEKVEKPVEREKKEKRKNAKDVKTQRWLNPQKMNHGSSVQITRNGKTGGTGKKENVET